MLSSQSNGCTLQGPRFLWEYRCCVVHQGKGSWADMELEIGTEGKRNHLREAERCWGGAGGVREPVT